MNSDQPTPIPLTLGLSDEGKIALSEQAEREGVSVAELVTKLMTSRARDDDDARMIQRLETDVARLTRDLDNARMYSHDISRLYNLLMIRTERLRCFAVAITNGSNEDRRNHARAVAFDTMLASDLADDLRAEMDGR